MKRIVLCCDGTWNRPGNKDRGQPIETNVEKIYKAINNENAGIQQIKFYGPGVGTGFAITDQLLGGSIGIGIDKNIQDAYKFLMWSYEPGDEIYLFGFSRGAYTVRSLGGLIRNCGIMQPAFMHLIGDAYQLYRDRTELTHPDSDTMKCFKKAYCKEEETKIKFMGVWDTVGALGIPISWFNWWNRKYQFHDVKLSSHIKYAYHALALDERRRVFSPAIWELNEDAATQPDPQICEQVWFPGVHANVGGGYVDCGLSNIALKWMIDKAHDTGLQFDTNIVSQLACDCEAELRGAMNIFYKLTGMKMRKVNINISRDGEFVKQNQKIHFTALERFHKIKKYKPKNLVAAVTRGTAFDPDRENWQDQWLEYLETVVREGEKNTKKENGSVVQLGKVHI